MLSQWPEVRVGGGRTEQCGRPSDEGMVRREDPMIRQAVQCDA